MGAPRRGRDGPGRGHACGIGPARSGERGGPLRARPAPSAHRSLRPRRDRAEAGHREASRRRSPPLLSRSRVQQSGGRGPGHPGPRDGREAEPRRSANPSSPGSRLRQEGAAGPGPRSLSTGRSPSRVSAPGRLGRTFERAHEERRGAFVPFLTSGFPDLTETDRLAFALCEEGADVLELGVPFSDPIADGPTIQRTAEAALRAGTTLAHVLGQAMRLRARHETPIVLMTYLNPILSFGWPRFAEEASAAGVDGVILVDLPPEEEPELWAGLRGSGLDTIALVAPTTDPSRLPRILQGSRGFLYVVARLGVTGAGAEDASVVALLSRCRELTPVPRCLGFGIGLQTPLERYRGKAEGVVVGSALLEAIHAGRDADTRETAARLFARELRKKLPALDPG